jgi:hypothetical protein
MGRCGAVAWVGVALRAGTATPKKSGSASNTVNRRCIEEFLRVHF